MIHKKEAAVDPAAIPDRTWRALVGKRTIFKTADNIGLPFTRSKKMAQKDLKQTIDLSRYPLDRADSEDYRDLVSKKRDELDKASSTAPCPAFSCRTANAGKL